MQELSVDSIKPGSFKVYISGVEIPAQSVSVTNTVGQFPYATIVVPPDKNLLRLGQNDRIEVAIFYLDSYYYKTQPRYCLLFDGEIRSWHFVKTPKGRSIQFSCVSFLQSLDFYNVSFLDPNSYLTTERSQ